MGLLIFALSLANVAFFALWRDAVQDRDWFAKARDDNYDRWWAEACLSKSLERKLERIKQLLSDTEDQ